MPPKFSIIIPARDEEKNLPACVASIRRAAGDVEGVVEIVVVVNRCRDRTEQVAGELGCRVVEDPGKNLAAIRNSGARAASGEILITIDADSRMSPNMLRAVEKALASGRYIGGGVAILFERWSLGIVATAVAFLPYVLYLGISAGLFFCRRDDFWAIGGFDEGFCSVEDIDFAVRMKRYGRSKGKRWKTILNAWITTSTRKFDKLGDWYFLRHPVEFVTILRGRHQGLADKIWYDFER